jgi:hypothetical protein
MAFNSKKVNEAETVNPDRETETIVPNETLAESYIPPWEARANDIKSIKEQQAIKAARKEANHKAFVRRKWRNRFIWVAFFYFIYWFYTPHGIFVLADPLSVSRYRGVLKDLKKDYSDKMKTI